MMTDTAFDAALDRFQDALCDLEDLFVELRTPPACAGCGVAWLGELDEPIPTYCDHCERERAADAVADAAWDAGRLTLSGA